MAVTKDEVVSFIDSMTVLEMSEFVKELEEKYGVTAAAPAAAVAVAVGGGEVAAEEKTSSGIIIPDTAKEKPLTGKVIAVGPGKKDESMSVKKGDTVLYGQYSGTEIKIENEDYLIMKESDIYGIC